MEVVQRRVMLGHEDEGFSSKPSCLEMHFHIFSFN